MNSAQMVTRVKELYGFADTSSSTDTGRPKNSVILANINEERRITYADMAVTMRSRLATTPKDLTYTANSEYVALPAEVVDNPILKVSTLNVGDPVDVRVTIHPVHVTEFLNYQGFGEPLVYAIVGHNIYLRPMPTVAKTTTFWYDPSVTDLDGTAGTTPSEMKADFHHILCYGACIRLRGVTNDPFDGMVSQYMRDRSVMLAYYEDMVPDHGIHEEERLDYG